MEAQVLIPLLPFDIQKVVRTLKQADFTERQAKAITATILSAFTESAASRAALV